MNEKLEENQGTVTSFSGVRGIANKVNVPTYPQGFLAHSDAGVSPFTTFPCLTQSCQRIAP
jgi:hypothetical protein